MGSRPDPDAVRTRRPISPGMHIGGPAEAMKRPSLLTQILALNLLMVTAAIFARQHRVGSWT